MLGGVDAFRDHAFTAHQGLGIGFDILRFLVQEFHHDRSQKDESQERNHGKDDDLPGDIEAQAGGEGGKTCADGEADGTEGSGANFKDNQRDGGDKPDLIHLHIAQWLLLNF